MEKTGTVIHVKPRRYPVHYKGLHGFVEYKPSDKSWHWSFKAQFTIKNEGTAPSKEHAELELKRYIDTAAVSKNIRSID